jgi:hypothetical protein
VPGAAQAVGRGTGKRFRLPIGGNPHGPTATHLIPEGVDDVGLMRDEESVLPFSGARASMLRSAGGSPTVFIGRHDETTLGQVGCLLDVLKSGEDRRLKGSVFIRRNWS